MTIISYNLLCANSTKVQADSFEIDLKTNATRKMKEVVPNVTALCSVNGEAKNYFLTFRITLLLFFAGK